MAIYVVDSAAQKQNARNERDQDRKQHGIFDGARSVGIRGKTPDKSLFAQNILSRLFADANRKFFE